MKIFYQYMAIFFNFSPTSNHLHSLKVENCGSNSWLVVNEDDNGKCRIERVNSRLNQELLGKRRVFNHQDLKMVGTQIKQIWIIFTHLKLWVAVARHNFKWVKIKQFNFAV